MTKLRLLFASMEMTPVAKVGGLADAVEGLARALAERGHDVTVVLPAYGDVLHGPWRPETLPHASLRVRFAGADRKQRFLGLRLPRQGPRVFLLDDPVFSGRRGIYQDPESPLGPEDAADRNSLFCLGTLALLERIDLAPHVIHAHDHQTALLATLLRRSLVPRPYFAKTRTMLTIHNLAFQGIAEKPLLERAGIDDAGFHPGGPLEFWGKVNLLKAGIVDADAVTTVSPTYAREVLSGPDLGQGLSGVLETRKEFTGITNGIDVETWNPSTDRNLAQTYCAEDLSGKAANRKALLERTDISLPPSRPLIGMVSRLVEQKGLELIERAWPDVAALNVGLVVLGSGDPRYESLFSALARSRPDRVYTSHAFDDPLAHLILGGSDILLMPSRYEPCGLTQMIALRYGTVPVVRRVGGLADTVRQVDADTGTGFFFEPFTPGAMVEALATAVRRFEDTAGWKKIMIRGMTQDFSWGPPAKRYEVLYRKLVDSKRPVRRGRSEA